MTEVVHADIFFLITAVAVIVVGVGAAILLYYAILIARDVQAITSKVRKASDELEQDFEELRARVRSEAARAETTFGMLLGLATQYLPTVIRARKKKKD